LRVSSVLPPREQWPELVPGDGSVLWRAFNDARMLCTPLYALLLQVAYPTVGHGVHQHSSFTEDPWGRLVRTLDYVHGTLYGGPELAGTIGRRVRAMHRAIRGVTDDGDRYSAMEPDAFAWVHATLAIAILKGHEHFGTRLSGPEQEDLWQQWMKVGRLIGVRERDLPPDVAGLRQYFDRVVREQLTWTPAVPEVLAGVKRPPKPDLPWLHPGVWRLVSAPLGRQLEVITAGLLPDELRDRLELRYSSRDRTLFGALSWVSRHSTPLVRGPLAEFGPWYVRIRGDALRG
jgi:uncharacterized protein (DUF2236 family)